MIPCADPRAGYVARKTEIDAAIHRVLDGGRYILGEEVDAFEREFAAYIGVAHGVGVGSGTEALHLALAACGVGPGNEVITVSHTAVATVAAIELAGATPVLIDIEPGYFTLDPARLEEAITPKTRAVIPVHLYGQPVDLEAILALARRRGIKVIEDCAQAHGATYHGRRVGAWGDISCFSFYPTKNLGALGDGGLVATNDPSLAARVRELREYGWTERYVSRYPGWNSRLDEVQAAVLRVKLRHLDADNASRVRFASAYDKALDGTGIEIPRRRSNSMHVFHLYVVQSNKRDALQAFLKERGVGAVVHYPVPVHLQPAYLKRIRGASSFAWTEATVRKVLSLPMHPELGERNLNSVVETVREFHQASPNA